MDTTIFNIHDEAIAASVVSHQDGDEAFYDFGDGTDIRGTILARPSRLGMHPRHGVMLTFGGYAGHFEIGDWALTGSLVCSGDEMTPGPAPTPSTSQYPLNQVRKDDPETADWISTLATAIAAHYAAHYTGRGLRD